jgi:hypothetical protein
MADELRGTDDDSAELAMRCVMCLQPIAKGTGHYRIVEGRFHVECLKGYWPRPSVR